MAKASAEGPVRPLAATAIVRLGCRSAVALALTLVAFPTGTEAQAQAQASARPQALATRAELESLAVSLENRTAAAGKPDVRARNNAQVIRARLSSGDFKPGDRVYVNITNLAGPEAHSHGPDPHRAAGDTVTVGAGSTLSLPGVGDVPLSGLLRSELQAAVEGAVARLYRNATVQTEPLIRIAVLEGVERPGYYDVSSNLVLSDLVMRAGGPVAKASLDRISVRRRGAELYSAARARAALQQQLTLDQLDIQTGDVVLVPLRRSTGMMQMLQIAASVATISLALIYGVGR